MTLETKYKVCYRDCLLTHSFHLIVKYSIVKIYVTHLLSVWYCSTILRLPINLPNPINQIYCCLLQQRKLYLEKPVTAQEGCDWAGRRLLPARGPRHQSSMHHLTGSAFYSQLGGGIMFIQFLTDEIRFIQI